MMRPVSRSLPVLLAACFVACAPTFAQVGKLTVIEPSRYLELLRTDIRADKVELLTESLNLTEAESAKFWPLYREYEVALASLNDRRIALLEEYTDNYGAVTESKARDFTGIHFGIERDKLRLRERYFRRIASATSAKIAARFIQVENVVASLISLQVGAELPLMQ